MKLLLDVHHSRLAAARLRAAGHDVTAAADDARLAALSDEDLLQAASVDGRALVTENVTDFDRIARSWASSRKHHQGIVFTSPHRYHRGRSSYPDDLVEGLMVLMAQGPADQTDWVGWLA